MRESVTGQMHTERLTHTPRCRASQVTEEMLLDYFFMSKCAGQREPAPAR